MPTLADLNRKMEAVKQYFYERNQELRNNLNNFANKEKIAELYVEFKAQSDVLKEITKEWVTNYKNTEDPKYQDLVDLYKATQDVRVNFNNSILRAQKQEVEIIEKELKSGVAALESSWQHLNFDFYIKNPDQLLEREHRAAYKDVLEHMQNSILPKSRVSFAARIKEHKERLTELSKAPERTVKAIAARCATEIKKGEESLVKVKKDIAGVTALIARQERLEQEFRQQVDDIFDALHQEINVPTINAKQLTAAIKKAKKALTGKHLKKLAKNNPSLTEYLGKEKTAIDGLLKPTEAHEGLQATANSVVFLHYKTKYDDEIKFHVEGLRQTGKELKTLHSDLKSHEASRKDPRKINAHKELNRRMDSTRTELRKHSQTLKKLASLYPKQYVKVRDELVRDKLRFLSLSREINGFIKGPIKTKKPMQEATQVEDLDLYNTTDIEELSNKFKDQKLHLEELIKGLGQGQSEGEHGLTSEKVKLSALLKSFNAEKSVSQAIIHGKQRPGKEYLDAFNQLNLSAIEYSATFAEFKRMTLKLVKASKQEAIKQKKEAAEELRTKASGAHRVPVVAKIAEKRRQAKEKIQKELVKEARKRARKRAKIPTIPIRKKRPSPAKTKEELRGKEKGKKGPAAVKVVGFRQERKAPRQTKGATLHARVKAPSGSSTLPSYKSTKSTFPYWFIGILNKQFEQTNFQAKLATDSKSIAIRKVGETDDNTKDYCNIEKTTNNDLTFKCGKSPESLDMLVESAAAYQNSVGPNSSVKYSLKAATKVKALQIIDKLGANNFSSVTWPGLDKAKTKEEINHLLTDPKNQNLLKAYQAKAFSTTRASPKPK